IQAAIAAKLAEQALQNAPALPEHIQAASSKKPNKKMLQLGLIPVDEALASLDDAQKNCAFARIALVSYVLVLYHSANRDA
ncbi:transposase, partial [Kingella kingae]|nr:transposase [Kingella kingae]